MNTTAKAVILNILLPGMGYLYYKLPQRKIVGLLLAILTFLEIVLFFYVPIAHRAEQLTFHWSPLFDPGRLALRVLVGIDTYHLAKKVEKPNRHKK